MATKTESKAQPKVLVVDDNEHVRISLARALEFKQFEIATAASVGEALYLIGTKSFDVSLSDLQLTEAGDGFTAVSAMHDKNPSALTLVYTGFPELKQALNAILR